MNYFFIFSILFLLIQIYVLSQSRYHTFKSIAVFEGSLKLFQVPVWALADDILSINTYAYVISLPSIINLFFLIFIVSYPKFQNTSCKFALSWVALHVPCLLSTLWTSIFFHDPNMIIYFILAVFYPILLYLMTSNKKIAPNLITDTIIVYLLISGLVILIFLPIEYLYRDASSITQLQRFTQNYSYWGALLLFFPFLTLSNQLNPQRFLLLIVAALNLALSFSRGVFISALILLFGHCYSAIKTISLFKFFNILTAFSIFLVFILIYAIEPENEIYTYWLTRLNIYNLDSNEWSFNIVEIFDLDKISEGSRLYLLTSLLNNITPLNFIFGNGIGSTRHIVNELTGGVYMYTSTHNLFFTVLIERGIFGVFAVVLAFYYYIKLIFINNNNFLSNFCFVLAFFFMASTTGLDLINVGSRSLNIEVSFVLFALLGSLAKDLKNKIL